MQTSRLKDCDVREIFLYVTHYIGVRDGSARDNKPNIAISVENRRGKGSNET